MHQELVILTFTFPCLVSFFLVSCLKTALKSQEHENENEVYQKTVTSLKKKKEKPKQEPKKKGDKVKIGDEVKEKKEKREAKKKTSKFFVFRGKDEDLKTPIGSDSLSPQATQSSGYSEESENEHISPLDVDSHMFSEQEVEEHLGEVVLLPTPPSDHVEKLRAKARANRMRKKSPREYLCPEDEDTLFSVPSLARDPLTMHSTSSMMPLDIQDSRILHVRNGWKKSHAIYAEPRSSKDSDSEITIHNL